MYTGMVLKCIKITVLVEGTYVIKVKSDKNEVIIQGKSNKLLFIVKFS